MGNKLELNLTELYENFGELISQMDTVVKYARYLQSEIGRDPSAMSAPFDNHPMTPVPRVPVKQIVDNVIDDLDDVDDITASITPVLAHTSGVISIDDAHKLLRQHRRKMVK